MKKFKTESKRVLDMMINSIYTHKEIFIRELLSNSSDAIDKLYYKSLTEGLSGKGREDYYIEITADKEGRTLTFSDNGIGMTKDELDANLGIIAKSGSFDFKSEAEKKEDINIIGQFGVGFYSCFMVSELVEVTSKAYGATEAYKWTSAGTDGYDITEAERESNGTTIVLHLKADVEEEKYSEYLEEYTIRELVKKYSDYIRYPIRMLTTKHEYDEESKSDKETKEMSTLNTMIPLWKKGKKDITKEEYESFYKDISGDYEPPMKVIHTVAEGLLEYKALLFIPSALPYNFYTKNYEKGLRLYTNGVLIMDKCADLLPDYFSFVKGLVDSELTLNISRETIQHNRQLKVIASNLEKKIKSELMEMQTNDRDAYVKFFQTFGLQIKYGVYDQWGAHKDMLKDLLVYNSVKEEKMVTLDEYVAKMPTEQKYIYYATGKTVDAIKALPQTEKVIDAGFDVLCMSDDIDEFAVKVLGEHKEKEFRSVAGDDLGLTEMEVVDEDKEIMVYLKDCLGDKVERVKPSHLLKSHPVCLTSEGEVSIEMEKVLNSMPGAPKGGVKAKKVLELNTSHSVYKKITDLYVEDKDKLKKLITVLYNQALLIEGLTVENPTELANSICDLI